jgi:hypothetical protein
MKTLLRLLPAMAVLLLAIFAQPCHAASQVTMDLTGTLIKSGSTIAVTSGTNEIDPAQIYYYSISGTIVGSGTLATLTGTGASFSVAVALADPALTPYLAGSVFNPTGKLPYICVNKLETGHHTFTSGPLAGATIYFTLYIKTGINKNGTCYGRISNFAFGIKSPLPRSRVLYDKGDSLQFLNGQILVQTSPFGGPPQPDLAFLLNGQLYGVGVSGTDGGPNGAESTGKIIGRGQSLVIPIYLRNLSSAPDSFAITATRFQPGFTEAVIYKGVNIGGAVTATGTTGYTIPPSVRGVPQTLPAGGITSFVWIITNRSAVSGFSSAYLNANSKTDSTKQDTISALAITPF